MPVSFVVGPWVMKQISVAEIVELPVQERIWLSFIVNESVDRSAV